MKKLKTLLVSLLAFFTLGAVACDKDDDYLIKFMDGNKELSELEVDKGETIQHGDFDSAPQKDGYKFDGWYLDANFETKLEDLVLSSDIVLYAKYTPNTYQIMFNVNGGVELQALSVSYNSQYSLPTPEKTGYTFTGWVLDGIEFEEEGTYTRTSSIRVTATWEINKYSVIYKDAEGETLKEVEVDYNTNAPQYTQVEPGYQIDGIYIDEDFETLFNNSVITAETTLYVKISPKTFNITVNEEGGTAVDTTAVFNETYTVSVPEKEGHNFIGFAFADGTPFNATGTYTWTENITVIAKWERQADYQKTGVIYYNEGVEIESYTTQIDDGTAYTIPQGYVATKKGHTFVGWCTDEALTTAYVNGSVINENHDGDYDLHLYAKFTANEYKISYNLAGGNVQGQDVIADETVIYGQAYTLKTPVRDGYSFEGYVYNEKSFASQGTYEIDQNVTVVATWKSLVADPDQDGTETFINKGKYFKVRNNVQDEFTFVFVTGEEYTFANHVVDVTQAGSSAESKNDSTFVAKAESGEFLLTLQRIETNGSITYTRKAIIVEAVNDVDYGANYQGSWMGTTSETYRSEFMDKKLEQNLQVGKSNFIPELSILGGNNSEINYASANLSVTVTVGGVASEDYTITEDGVINFGDSLVGQTATVSFVPYFNVYSVPAVSFIVDINDGVNVYTNEELRSAFKDLSKNKINVLRNITARVDKAETVNGEGVYASNTYHEGSVYGRITSSTNDQVTVNGNFFSIVATEQDGVTSTLPVVHNEFSYRDWSVAGESGYYVANVQNGIFSYMNRDGATEGTRMHNGVLTINDLFISGNNVGDTSATVDYKGSKLLVNSGTYHGIVVRGGTANVNNTTIKNTNTALFSDSEVSANLLNDNKTQAVHWNINGVKTDNSFSNSLYLYGVSKVDIKNSYFGKSSSSVINLDDVPVDKSVATISTEITVDDKTTFNNLVIGTETWFVAYGMGDVASQVTIGVEQYATMVSSGTKTVMKNDNGQNKFNFVFFIRAKGDAAEWTSDYNERPYAKFTCNGQTLLGLATSSGADILDHTTEVLTGGQIINYATQSTVTVSGIATNIMTLHVELYDK